MSEIEKCKTCGRRPSERIGRYEWEVGNDVPMVTLESCDDPLHDLADRLASAPAPSAGESDGYTETVAGYIRFPEQIDHPGLESEERYAQATNETWRAVRVALSAPAPSAGTDALDEVLARFPVFDDDSGRVYESGRAELAALSAPAAGDARDAVIEECATVCDANARGLDDSAQCAFNIGGYAASAHFQEAALRLNRAAAELRALKGRQP
jgi:hypothetical protein